MIRYCLITLLILAIAVQTGISKTHYISPNSNSKLSSVVKLANPGDTIMIKQGYYNEHSIIIDKPLTIIGQNYPVIDANYSSDLLTISSNNVTVLGLHLKNIEYNSIRDNSAILIENSDSVRIIDNIIEDAYFAIYLKRSNNAVIKNNRISGNAVREALSGNAIHVWYCNYVEIDNNTAKGHRDGIYIEFSKKCTIINNHSESNIRYGLHFMFSDSCHYEYNHFTKNGAGVAVMYSKFINMSHNTFEHSTGTASYGLLLKDISDSDIRNNIFYRNTIGIFAEGSNRVNIEYNIFRYNAWGLRIYSNCYDLIISKNDFFTNSFEFATNRGSFNNIIKGNYWSSYDGYDLNKDGTGDIPHRPMSLFGYLVMNFPESLVLHRSIFIRILNFAERVLPSVTPKTVFDESPSIKPVVS